MSTTEDFYNAIASGNQELVDHLLNQHVDLLQTVSPNGISPILWALYNQHEKLAVKLAERKPNLDLFEAVCTGDIQRLQTLILDEKTDIKALSGDGFSAAGYAAFFGQLAVLEFLLKHNADIHQPSKNQMSVYPIHSASANSDPDISLKMVQLLLEHGANPNVRQKGGWAPLHQAVNKNHVSMVKVLLEHGADPDSESDEGVTPRQIASDKKLTEIIKLFK